MRNPSGGAPALRSTCTIAGMIVSIDEKPVRRCAARSTHVADRRLVSIDEKPVRRCAADAIASH